MSTPLERPADEGSVFSLGSYRVVTLDSVLTFPEKNRAVMEFTQMTSFEVVTPTQFFERRFFWTGKGVMDPPRIEGSVNGEETRFSRHGPIYRKEHTNAYLVNLGSVIQAGSLVTVTTLARFVDESLTFMPYLAVAVMPRVEHMTVRMRSVEKVDDVSGKYTSGESIPGESSASITESDVEVDMRNESGYYEYRLESAEPAPGTYRLSWQPNPSANMFA